MRMSVVQKVGVSFLVATILFAFSGSLILNTVSASPISKPKKVPIENNSANYPASIAPSKPSASCPQPDRHQDISTLTLQERVNQGYPIPIKGKTDPNIDKVIHDKGKHFCADTDVPRTLHSSVNHAESNDRIWSGNYADGGGYTFIQASWTQSCIAFGSNDHYSTWVGIGGVYDNNLVQTGTDGNNWNVVSHGYDAWVENTQNGYDVNVFNINCGDHMYAEVGAGNCMQVIDKTSGASSGWRCSGANASQSTAECIIEAPTISGSIANLSNYGNQQFTGCDVEVNAGSTIGINTVPHDYFNMYNGGTLLSSTGSIKNNDTYTMTWHNYY